MALASFVEGVTIWRILGLCKVFRILPLTVNRDLFLKQELSLPLAVKELIINPYFKYFIVTLITTALSIFVKVVSRNDRYVPFKKEDLAVGMEISVTGLILFITSCVDYTKALLTQLKSQTNIEEKYMQIPWVIFALLLGLWSMSTLIRKKGWTGPETLHIWYGIILPDLYGLITLIFVVNWIK